MNENIVPARIASGLGLTSEAARTFVRYLSRQSDKSILFWELHLRWGTTMLHGRELLCEFIYVAELFRRFGENFSKWPIKLD